MPSLATELRALGLRDEQIARCTYRGKPITEEAEKPRSRFRSKTEAAYSFQLDWELKEGTIARYEYESLKFRLADGAWFTPDFAVWMPDGRLELREIKGGGFVREAARIRFLVAKRLYPEFGWRMITREKHSGWIDIL